MRDRWLSRPLALVVLLGCNAIVGIEEPTDAPVAPPAPADPFVGRWVSDVPPAVDRLSGCANPRNSVDLNGRYIFNIKRLPSGAIQGTNEANPACQATLTVEGSSASLASASSCVFTGFTVQYKSMSMTLTGSGIATLAIAGTATGSGDTCQYEAQLTLRRDGG